MTSTKPERAKMVHTVWHLFSRRIKAVAFFSSSGVRVPSGVAPHDNSAVKSNNDTRLRSMLSKGGSSRRDVNVLESVENNGGHPARNGVVDKDAKAWALWWICSTLWRDLEFPDSNAEGVCTLSAEIDLGGAYLSKTVVIGDSELLVVDCALFNL